MGGGGWRGSGFRVDGEERERRGIARDAGAWTPSVTPRPRVWRDGAREGSAPRDRAIDRISFAPGEGARERGRSRERGGSARGHRERRRERAGSRGVPSRERAAALEMPRTEARFACVDRERGGSEGTRGGGDDDAPSDGPGGFQKRERQHPPRSTERVAMRSPLARAFDRWNADVRPFASLVRARRWCAPGRRARRPFLEIEEKRDHRRLSGDWFSGARAPLVRSGRPGSSPLSFSAPASVGGRRRAHRPDSARHGGVQAAPPRAHQRLGPPHARRRAAPRAPRPARDGVPARPPHGRARDRDLHLLRGPARPDATGALSFDAPALAAQQARYKQVFPAFDVVGWYATAAAEARPDAEHLRLHRSLAHLDENPAFALFTPGSSSGSSAAAAKEPTTSTTKTTASTLPITLYESVVRATETRFEPVEYTLATSEAERVAVDDAARSASLGWGAPGREREASEGYLAHLRGLASALEMLEGRVSVLVEYLKAVERGDRARGSIARRCGRRRGCQDLARGGRGAGSARGTTRTSPTRCSSRTWAR